MRLERTGSRFWADFDDPDWNGQGDAPPRIRREVVMITGSHHQQIYWYATGRHRLLGQLPGAYLIAEERWIPRRMAILHPPSDPVFSETGHWNSTCIACHATQGKPRFDTPFGSAPIESQRVDTMAIEFGISCEACHGPSATHVRANRNPLRRYGLHFDARGDTTTVEPTRLPPKVSSQTCGQCHGIWEFYDATGERQANWDGLPFRPGDELATTRFFAQPTVNADSPAMKTLLADDAGFIRDSFWADGKVRVSGREYNGLVESPCFKNATDEARTLSCFSCHTLHKPASDARPMKEWANDQLTSGKEGNEACLSCHEPYRAKLTEHTRHAADSEGSSCYNCHMPYTTYGLLKTMRSHTISSPSVAESATVGRPNACNLCHLDKTLAWTSDALERWYGTPPVPLGPEDQSVAASLVWMLKGDAGHRVIAAQTYGWPPAQRASGTDWMAPFLSELLDDPYDAVRFIASRSLRTLPPFARFEYDFIAPASQRRQAQLRSMTTWDRARPPGKPSDAHLLFTSNGTVDVEAVLRLLKQRDNRRVLLRE
jgi:nitrate/TMAO reductase-like tetraheme cytochrome c subunit